MPNAPVDPDCPDCTTVPVDENKIEPCEVIVYNAVTPNGDGVNDYFRIEKGDCAGPLHVEIFNRWGVQVFETDNYGRNGDVFDGYSNGRMTINSSHQLPTGTYYYILEYDYDNGSGTGRHQKAGYLYLSGNKGNNRN